MDSQVFSLDGGSPTIITPHNQKKMWTGHNPETDQYPTEKKQFQDQLFAVIFAQSFS